MDTGSLLLKCVELAKEKKAGDIIALSLGGLTIIADYFLIMTAANSRQAKAVADYLDEETKKLDNKALRIEGHSEGRWILMDYGSVIVHIFLEEEREYYNLEKLWEDAPKESF